MAKRTKKTPQLFMSPDANEHADTTPEQTDQPEPAPAKTNSLVAIPLPSSGPNSWKEWNSRIKKSSKIIEDFLPEWRGNQRRYLNKKKTSQHAQEVMVPTLFQRVESKKSSLVALNPYVVVKAKHPASTGTAPLMEAVLNDVLGAAQPDGVDAMVMLEEVMSDALCPSGIFACYIGYEAFVDGTKDVQTGTQPDPNWVAPDPSTLLPGQPPPQAPMVPVMETVPNVVFEKYSMDRLSPAKLLIPEDFKGSDYDRAAWLGYEFVTDFYLANRKWKLPEDFDAFITEDEHLIDPNVDGHSGTGDKRKRVRGWVIFYKTAVFDKNEAHPYKQRCLVLIDGINDVPVYHKDSDFQWQNEDGTLGGMTGFPIHIGALRYVSDSAFPPSDASMSKYQDIEISEGRTDMKLQRKRNIPMRIADASKLKESGLAKIEKGIWQAVIPLDGDVFADDKLPIRDVQQAQFPQENFTFDTINNRDNDATWGLGAAPGGAIPGGTSSTSATQAGAAQASSQSRIGRERNKFTAWYARAVEKLAPLYQHFMTDTQYVDMVGPDGAKTLVEWNKENIAGKFGFSILPNSSVDVTEQRSEFMGFFNLAAKRQDINQRQLDTEAVKAFGKDPGTMMNPPPEPQKPPAALPHGISLNLDEKGLNPLTPAFPLIISLLRAAGVNIPDDAIAQAQTQAKNTGLPTASAGNVTDGQVPPPPPPAPPQQGPPPPPQPHTPPGLHGSVMEGSAAKADTLDKHQFDRSGELPGPGPKPTQ